MKFVRYTVEDFGKVFTTYPEFFTQHNLSKEFYNFGANILPPKVEILASYTRKLDFDEEVEEANDASYDFKENPALEKILKKDWILVSDVYPHESYDYNICVIMKDFRVGENQAFFPYCRPQKLLIEVKGIKEQNEFKGFNRIWEKTL